VKLAVSFYFEIPLLFKACQSLTSWEYWCERQS